MARDAESHGATRSHARGQAVRVGESDGNPQWRLPRVLHSVFGFSDGWRGMVFALFVWEANTCAAKYLGLYMTQQGVGRRRILR